MVGISGLRVLMKLNKAKAITNIMDKDNIFKLIDYYIDEYQKEIEHYTDGFARSGMIQGLIWICRFYNISEDDLGEERLNKITKHHA